MTMEELRGNVELSTTWNVLGPFQIGTREAAWGADPLEYYGGFRNLTFDSTSSFKSSLGRGGTVQWSKFRANHRHEHPLLDGIDLNVHFSDVDWESFRSTYGWAALQHQAWARGIIHVTGTQTHHVALYADKVLEFWVDGQCHFGGDFYGFRRAPLVLHLENGDYIIDVRLIGDIRSMGAKELPTIRIRLDVFDAPFPAMIHVDHIILPDVVGGKLASGLASVPVTNTGCGDLILTNIISKTPTVNIELLKQQVHLRSGQTRPAIFQLRLTVASAMGVQIEFELMFEQPDGSSLLVYSQPYQLKNRSFSELHKFTYLHPGGMVSYAMLRPPPKLSSLPDNKATERHPVFIFLHGSGVEVSSDEAAHCLDAVSDLPVWTLFPSGVTLWSGDDWHQWGWADVKKALDAIPKWIMQNEWQGSSVDTEQWMVAGHSNGGQGAWYALTHRPDNVLAAISVSGYLSIQKYVPYTFWREVEPHAMAIVQSSLNSFRHELLIANSTGIPVMHQHGDADDNVPPFHSRRIGQLLSEARWGSRYNEIPHAGHWFDGVMTTNSLQRFYRQNVMSRPELPGAQLTRAFSLVTGNPGETGSKLGFRVNQLLDPAKLGRLDISIEAHRVCMHTSNVRKLSIPLPRLSQSSILIDEQDIPLGQFTGDSMFLLQSIDGTWQILEADKFKVATERQEQQLGNIQSILTTRGPLAIVLDDGLPEHIALQTSRNLFQYYGADVSILSPIANLQEFTGNIIRMSVQSSLPFDSLDGFPINISRSAIMIRDHLGYSRKYASRDNGLGCIFLRPLGLDRLELVVWGSAQSSLAVASRLVPTLTGVGQPDFIILTRKCLSDGIGGVLAMGYLDYLWRVSPSSFFS